MDENVENKEAQTKAEEQVQEDNKKKPKKQGPIRTGLVIALIVLAGLVYGYTKFFFDNNLKSLVEIAGTSVNGAEVNVQSISTSFLGGSFQLKGLQVTDKENPIFNKVEIGEINFNFLWDALLRAKFVVEESSIKNVQVNSKRKKAGKVVPVEPVKEGSGKGRKSIAALEKAVLDQGKKEFEGNALGDIANLLDGQDPADQLKSIQGELITEQKLTEIEADVKNKEEQWKADLDKLKQVDELKGIASDLKGFKFNKKRPDKSIKELGNYLKDSKNKVKEFNDSYKRLKSDIDKYKNVTKDVDKWIKEDTEALKNRFKIPDFDLSNLSKQLFAKMFLSKLGEYRKYIEMAKEYMPPSKEEKIAMAKAQGKTLEEIEKEAAPPKPKARAGGVNVKFPITTGYPLFWLKKSIISSKSTDSPTSGDVEGTFENFTSHPKIINKVSRITVKGDFPHQQIKGLDATVLIDRTKAIPTEKVVATVASYPVGNQMFSKTEKLEFGIDKAIGKLELNMSSSLGNVESQLQTKFVNVDYVVNSNSKIVKEMFTNVVNDVGPVMVNANAKGKWEDLDWRINSNLGRSLERGLKKEVQSKVDEAKAKVEKLIEDRIGGRKNEVLGKVNKAKNEVESKLNAKKKEVDKAQKTVTGDVNKKKKEGKSAAKNKIKDKGKKLLKKFKF